MPLSKVRMRERKKRDRSVKPKSNLNTSSKVLEDVKPKLAQVGVKLNGNRIVTTVKPETDETQSKSSPLEEEPRHILPFRSGVRYKPGTELLDPKTGEIITAPEIDADGQEIW